MQFSGQVLDVAIEMQKLGLITQFIIISNDPTWREIKKIESLKTKCPPYCDIRIEFVARETLYASWNRGVRMSDAPIICFWNVDDLRNAKALAEGVDLIKSGNDFVCFPYIVFNKSRKAFFTDLLDLDLDLRKHNFVIGPFFMVSKALFNKVGPFDEQFHITGDFEWQFRVATATPFSRGNSIGGLFIADGNNLSSKMSPRHYVERNIIFTRYQLPELLHPLSAEQMDLFCCYQVEWKGNAPRTSDENFTLDAYWDRRRMFWIRFDMFKDLTLWPVRRLMKMLYSLFS